LRNRPAKSVVDCAIDMLRANRQAQPGRPCEGAQAAQRADVTLVTEGPAQAAH
jgi:hypothetical protein